MDSLGTTDTTLTMTSSSMSDVGELTEESIRHLQHELGMAMPLLQDSGDFHDKVTFPNDDDHVAPLPPSPDTILLYDTIDLDALVEENVGVKKLLATLAKTKESTRLVSKFVCRDWPEWFPVSPYGAPLNQQADEVELEEEAELQNTFLASTLVLVVSRMTKLRDLVVPSCHPFFFSEVGPGMRWTGLKAIEFGNVVLGDEEACDMFEWLTGTTSVERLSFPRLAEKAEIPGKTSNDSPLLEYANSPTFLPNLKALHAPPGILSVLTTSAAVERSGQLEEEEEESPRKPWRPLEDVTVNIDRTLYNGLRPKALLQDLEGLKRFGLKCGKNVDRRTVEKVLIAAGSNSLEGLELEFTGECRLATGTDEVGTILPLITSSRDAR
jgi:hypothetical protein